MKFVKYDLRLFKKVPYPVLLSASRGIPRFARDDKKRARDDKRGRSGRRPGMSSRGAQAPRDPSADASGRQKKEPRGDSRRACI